MISLIVAKLETNFLQRNYLGQSLAGADTLCETGFHFQPYKKIQKSKAKNSIQIELQYSWCSVWDRIPFSTFQKYLFLDLNFVFQNGPAKNFFK